LAGWVVSDLSRLLGALVNLFRSEEDYSAASKAATRANGQGDGRSSDIIGQIHDGVDVLSCQGKVESLHLTAEVTDILVEVRSSRGPSLLEKPPQALQRV